MAELYQIDAALRAVPDGWSAAAGFVVGGIIGSFLATILVRWPKGETVRGRLRCDGCSAALHVRDLVPLVSYAAAQGRCRRCGTAIDPRHFGVELAAALVGAAAFLAHQGVEAILSGIFGWWLLLLAALDVEERWLPDRLTLPLIPAGWGAALLFVGPPIGDRLIGAAAGFASLSLIGFAYWLLRKRVGLGGADPKLLAGIGAWLGWQQLPLVLVGAGLFGIASLLFGAARGKRVSADDRLPLGALMALSAWPLWLLVSRA